MTMAIGVRDMIPNALDIPKLTHAEAGKLAQAEYERVLALLETLSDEDWQQPTYCTEWNVRDMVAHLAGAMTGSASFAEFRRQNITHPYVKQFANPVDGTNKLQIEERAGKTPAELIAEFRQSGQMAIRNRRNLPWLARKIRVPMGELGWSSFEYLFDVIYPRDEWMHRYDICAATGKKMEVTEEHDGRMVALVLLDVAKKLKKSLANRAILLHLSGSWSGDFLFGNGGTPECSLEMDVFDFNLRASGRITVEETLRRTAFTGDKHAATWFLMNMEVPY